MNLILQVIKSLFRKVESKIARLEDAMPHGLDDLLHGKKIPGNSVGGMYYSNPNTYGKTLVPESTFQFEKDEERGYGRYIPLDSDGNWNYDVYPENNAILQEVFDNGWSISVVWDGEEYTVPLENDEGYFSVGNTALNGKSFSFDSGEPFYIDFLGGNGLVIDASDNSDTHSVEIRVVTESGEFKRMPRRFLPPHEHQDIIPVRRGGTGADNTTDAGRAMGFFIVEATLTSTSNNYININDYGFRKCVESAQVCFCMVICRSNRASNISNINVGKKTYSIYKPFYFDSNDYHWFFFDGNKFHLVNYFNQ